jgi:ectoine hydroxylase-related dioxygenase (phytanoyl-CoA dioxygenase family)
VNFWEDTTFIKSPGATARTAFHQDYTYFQITGRKCCIAWIALDETTPENGALEYVRGSHTWGQEFAPNLFIAQTVIPESPAGRLPDIEAQRSAYDIVQVCAKPGDVIFHDVMTVHGAGGNTTRDQMRRGISFRYCGDDIRYADKRGAIPQPWVSQKLADGDPIRDCPDYPLVWPKPA